METLINNRMFFVLDTDDDIIEKFETREDLEEYLSKNHEEVNHNNYQLAEVNKLNFNVTPRQLIVLDTPDDRKRNRSKANRDPITGRALKKDGTPYKSRKKDDVVGDNLTTTDDLVTAANNANQEVISFFNDDDDQESELS